MEVVRKYPEKLVFGLDIGTRSIVGTVGYKVGEQFYVVAQRIKEHETRSMLDGQIHDIGRVGATILQVRAELEKATGEHLSEVCIAAAGRVLKTLTIHTEQEFEEEREVTMEDIYALDSKGIEAAYEQFNQNNDSDLTFYCVGYSVMRYYMNNYVIGNLESHKARTIGVDLIATFLPEDVVDGLYKAVGIADLEVVNMTLEPIAAIQVAIPEMYRMLNIALVDVGAGTSDISITRGGSIIAYGMIPIAGDALTEAVAQHCLVDFVTAEQIKRDCGEKEVIEYKDIMGLTQTITREELLEVVEPVVQSMTKQVSDKIRELNGDKSVSAVFVVGGGGKIPSYTGILAQYLEISPDRVALRGEEVMQKVKFLEKETKKDSLLVTPIGICLSYYEQTNSFIFVTFNNRRIKIYDNSRLSVVDAAMQAEFPNESLFPKRGTPLHFTVDGKSRMIRGELGEACVITVNGAAADIYTPIHANDVIVVQESTAGAAASLEINKLPEYNAFIRVEVNEKKINLPKFARVNGTLQSGYYDIQENDRIEMLRFYTIRQVAEFMDVTLQKEMNIYVNNKLADMDTEVYENFSVIWTLEKLELSDVERLEAQRPEPFMYETYADLPDAEDEDGLTGKDGAEPGADSAHADGTQTEAESTHADEARAGAESDSVHADEAKTGTERAGQDKAGAEPGADSAHADEAKTGTERAGQDKAEAGTGTDSAHADEAKAGAETGADSAHADRAGAAGGDGDTSEKEADGAAESGEENAVDENGLPILKVIVNDSPVILRGKASYVFVDVFDWIDFDLSRPKGKGIVTKLNGRDAQYMEALSFGDKLEIYWRE